MSVITPVVRVAAVLALTGMVAMAVASTVLRRSVEQLREDRALVARREELGTEVERLLNDLQATGAERTALRRVRPHASNLVRLVEGLEAAATRAFVDQTIAAIPLQSDQSGQPYPLPVVRYRVTLQGTAEKLETYLRELARLPELIRVERMDLKAPPDGHVMENMTAEIVFAVAVQNAP